MIWKDPSSVEPQGFDYTKFLAELSAMLGSPVTISLSTWAVSTGVWDPDLGTAPGDSTPLAIGGPQIVGSGLKTQVTLSAGTGPAGPPGTKGYRYWVTNHFTTSSGVVDERSFEVQVVQR